MQSFLSRHQDQIQGTISGFDRLRFMGSLRILSFSRRLGESPLGRGCAPEGLRRTTSKDSARRSRRPVKSSPKPRPPVASSTYPPAARARRTMSVPCPSPTGDRDRSGRRPQLCRTLSFGRGPSQRENQIARTSPGSSQMSALLLLPGASHVRPDARAVAELAAAGRSRSV